MLGRLRKSYESRSLCERKINGLKKSEWRYTVSEWKETLELFIKNFIDDIKVEPNSKFSLAEWDALFAKYAEEQGLFDLTVLAPSILRMVAKDIEENKKIVKEFT